MISLEDAGKITNAVRFYLSPFEPLLAAMVQAEGGPDAFIKAVRCSPEFAHITTFEQALAVACKTVRNKLFESPEPLPELEMRPTTGFDPWTSEAHPRTVLVTEKFIDFLGSSWAPEGAKNDPQHLNENWDGNVIKEMRKNAGVAPDPPTTSASGGATG